MKLHLPHLLRRAVLRAIIAASALSTTLFSATYAAMITPDGRTDTTVMQQGHVYDVYTNTVRGQTGFNSFSTFDVYAGSTANLHLAAGTANLVNVVRDKCSYIDGVLNSYKDGQIGGNVFFLNPNGIVVGKSGVVNVGSISMSTPTACFVEQLIARDGSISPTATAAVLAGDMPINEKGLISVKGKVHALDRVEMRAGKVEVQGDVATKVKMAEVVNTNGKKMDTKGMRIEGGKLSFGKKPRAARKPARKAEQPAGKKNDIEIFAEEVSIDGGMLAGEHIYIDPDKLAITNTTLSGNYRAEARELTLDNVQSSHLQSLTLHAGNELADGTFAGDVSLTITNSDLTTTDTGFIFLSAEATTENANAAITISGSTISAIGDKNPAPTGEESSPGVVSISAASKSGQAAVTVGDSDVSGTTISVSAQAAGNAAVTLADNGRLTTQAAPYVPANGDSTSEKKAYLSEGMGTIRLAAVAQDGDATITQQAGSAINAEGNVTLAATVGRRINENAPETGDALDPETELLNTTPTGSGNALVSVAGTLHSKGSITLQAVNDGISGNADVRVEAGASLIGDGTQTAPLGVLIPERLENETDEQYAERWSAHLKSASLLTAPTSGLSLSADAASGNASLTVGERAELMANQAATLRAEADKGQAVISFGGKLTSGAVTASAVGATAELRVLEGGVLRSVPVTLLMTEQAEDGSLYYKAQKMDAGISLTASAPAAGTGSEDDDTPAAPSKKDGVLLEVAGSVLARREEGDEEGVGGQIQLLSDGTLSVTDTAVIDAGSAVGGNGRVAFSAPEYAMSHAATYNAAGSDGSKGSLELMNMEVREIAALMDDSTPRLSFLREEEELNANGGESANEWNEGTFCVSFDGDIVLKKDVDASVQKLVFTKGTTVSGNGHSLKLRKSTLWSVVPLPFMADFSIADDVTITDVKDFSLTVDSFSYTNLLANIYANEKQRITVGDNFTLSASGKVTMSTEGYFWNEISFGKNARISAIGDITLSAKTDNGLGFALFTGSPINATAMLKKGLNAAGINNSVLNGIGDLGFVKVDLGKALYTVLYRGIKKSDGSKIEFFNPEELSSIVLGFRVSHAEISFKDNDAGIRSSLSSGLGNIALTVDSAATIKNVSKTQPIAGVVSPTIGVISNTATLNLGTTVDFAAQNIILSNKTKAASDLTNTIVNGKQPGETLFSFGVGVVINKDTLTIGKGSTLVAAHDITISTADDVTNSLTLIAGGGKKSVFQEGEDGHLAETEKSMNTAAQKYAVTLGTTLLSHKNETVINGDMTAVAGNISVATDLKEKAALSTSTELCYTLATAAAPKKDEGILHALWDCVQFEGFSALYKDRESIKNTFKKGEELYGLLASQLNAGEANKLTAAVSTSANIATADNVIRIGGTVDATEGSITLAAKSALSNSTSSGSTIRGVPSDTAVTGAITVPVYNDSCVVDISGTLTAGRNLTATASTSYPVSLNYLGWNDWFKTKNADGSKRTPWENVAKGLADAATFIRKHYKDGSFGLISDLPTTGATTQMYKTGSGESSKAVGGDIVVENHHTDTVVNVRDGATLQAGGAVTLSAQTAGQQVIFAGNLPFYLQLGADLYATDKTAASGFGGSFLFSRNSMNTVTYVGAATIEADALKMDSRDAVFSMASSVAGTGGADTMGIEGGVNIVLDEKMTVSEVSNGASVTLGSGASAIHAKDDTTTLNIVGMEADGGRVAVGAGIAATVDFSYTAALLGNNSIPAEYRSNWESVNKAGGKALGMDSVRAGDITLSFSGKGALEVKAEDDSNMAAIGISGAKLSRNNNKKALGGGADNVAVTEAKHHTAATVYKVQAAEAEQSDITVNADNDAVIVSVAGDVAANVSGEQTTVNEALSVAVNYTGFDTKASVIDSVIGSGDGSGHTPAGTLTVHAHNRAVTNAVTLAGTAGGATVSLAAGSAWNSMTGTTGAYTTGGSLSANSIAVTADSTQDIVAVTIGSSLNLSIIDTILRAAPEKGMMELVEEELEENALKKDVKGPMREEEQEDELLNAPEEIDLAQLPSEEDFAFGTENDILPAEENGLTVSGGASVARSTVDTHTEALVTDTTLSAMGAVTVTAEDNSVISQISGGVSVKQGFGDSGGSMGAVLSFIPVTSRVYAGIIGSKELTLTAAQLDVHATAAQNARNWSLGVGLASGSGCGAVVAWSNFNDSYARAELTNVNASVSGSGHEKHDVNVEAYNHQQATVISAGASAGNGFLELSGVWNHASFGGAAQTIVSCSTLTMTHANGGDIFLHAKTQNELFDLMGSAGLQLGSGTIAGVGAAVSTVYLNKNDAADSYTSRVLVTGSTINNTGKTEIKAENTTTGGVYGGAVSATTGMTAVDGTFSWLTDYSRTEALVQDSVLKGAGGVFSVDANSHSDVTSGVGAGAIQLGSGIGAGAFVVSVMKDHGTTEATVRNSTVGEANALSGSLSIHAAADTHMNAILIGGSVGNFAGITGQVMYAGLEHKVHATVDNSDITLSGNLDIGAENTVTAGRDKWCLTIGSLSVGYGGGGIGISLLFLNDDDDTAAILNGGEVTAGSVSVTSSSTNTGSTATLTAAGGFYGGGVVNVNRSDLTAHSNALVSGNGSLTTTAGGLNVRSELEQALDTYAAGAALAGVGALTLNINLMNVEGGSQALVSDARTLNLDGDLTLSAAASRNVGYVAFNFAGSMVGAVANISLMNLSRDTDAAQTDIAFTDNSATDAKLNAMLLKGLSTADTQLKGKNDPDSKGYLDDYTGPEKQTPAPVSLTDAKNAHHVGENSNVQAGLNLTRDGGGIQTAAVGGDVRINAEESITTHATNVDVAGGIGSLGLTVIKTKMAPVTLTTVSGVTLNAGGDISLSATGRASDKLTDVGVRIGGGNLGLSFYDWENKAQTDVKVGETSALTAQRSLSLNAQNDSEETFDQTSVHGGIADVAVMLPKFTQSCTASLSVGDNATLTAADVTLTNRNDLTLNVDMLDIVAAGLGVGVTKQRTGITDREFITIGANAVLTATDTLTLNNLANKNYTLLLHHAGVSLVEFAFPELEAENTVAAGISIGNRATLKGKTVRITSGEALKREATLKGQTGSLGSIGSNDINRIIVNDGSLNAATFGDHVTLGGDVQVNVTTTDNSDIYTNAIKVSLLEIATATTIENKIHLKDRITFGEGLTMADGSLNLESMSKVDPLKALGESYGGGIIDVGVNLKETLEVDLNSDISMKGGALQLDGFTAHALTDARTDEYGEVRGGSVVDSRDGKSSTTVTQNAEVNLAAGGESLTITADNVDVLARNTHLRSNAHSNDIWGDTGGMVPLLEVKTTVDSTFTAKVNWGSAATLKRHLTPDAYEKRKSDKVSFRAENNANLTTKARGAAGGLGGKTEGIVELTTTATATTNLQGDLSAWNAVDAAAVSDISHTSSLDVRTPVIGPGKMTHKNSITLNDTLTAAGHIETAGSVSLTSQGLMSQNVTNKLDGDNTSRGRSVSKTDNSALTLTGTVKAGGDATLTSTKNMTLNGSVWAGMGGYIEATLLNKSTKPQIKGYIDYMADSLFGTTDAPEFRVLSNDTAALFLNNEGRSVATLFAAGGSLRVDSPDAGDIDTTKLHVIKNALADITIAFGYDTDIKLGNITVDNSGGANGAFINGKPFTAAELSVIKGDSQIRISNWSNSKLVLAGAYTALNAGMKVYSVGDIDFCGSSNVFWLDVYTEGNISTQTDYYSQYTLNQLYEPYITKTHDYLNDYCLHDAFNGGTDYWYETTAGEHIEGSYDDVKHAATGSHVLRAASSINIHAKVADLGGSLIVGNENTDIRLSLDDSTKLWNATHSAQLTINEAISLYNTEHGNSAYTVVTKDGGSHVYFDAATQRFGVQGLAGEDNRITIEADYILNSMPEEGKGQILVQEGSCSLFVNNTSSYELDLKNIDLNSQTKGIITLKDRSGTYTYTRDANGRIHQEIEKAGETASDTTIYQPQQSATFTPYWNYLDAKTIADFCVRDDGVSYCSCGVPEYAAIRDTSKSAVICYSQEELQQGRREAEFWGPGIHFYTCYFHAERHMYFRADHPVEISFSGTQGLPTTLNADSHKSISVGGMVSADTVVLTSSKGEVNLAANAALTGKNGLTVTASGNINFGQGSMLSGAAVNLTAKDTIGTETARGTIAGDAALTAKAAKEIAFDATHNLTAGAIQADTVRLNVSGNLSRTERGRLTAETATVTAGGDMDLNTKVTDYLDGAAGGSITLSQDADTVLYLRHLTSERGNISVTAAKGIQAYYHLDVDKVLGDEELNKPLSLLDAAQFYSEEYREQYVREMEEYRRYYELKDKDGHYVYRDAEGNFALPAEQRQTREQHLHDIFLDEYNSGHGEALAESIYRLSGSDYVGGCTFSSLSDAETYICTRTEEAAQGFAVSQLDVAMAQLTARLKEGSVGSEETQMNALSFDISEWKPYHKNLWQMYYEAHLSEEARRQPGYVPVMQETADGVLAVTPSGGYKYIVNEETQKAVSEWLRESPLGEQLYKLYWKRDTAGELLYQDEAHHFIGPMGTNGVTPLYNTQMCEMVTELFKGTDEAQHYSLTVADREHLLQQGKVESGYSAAEDLLHSVKNALYTLGIGMALEETETVISAKNGALSLTSEGGAGIGSDKLTVLLKADSTDGAGKPVYSAWKQAYIQAAAEDTGLTILSGGLNAAETRVRIDGRSFTEKTMTALDLATLLSASSVSTAYDAATGLTTYTATPTGYLGVESKSLTVRNGSGNVYLTTPGDLHLTDYTLSSHAHFSAVGNIAGTTVTAAGSGTHTLGFYAWGHVGNETKAMTLAQGSGSIELNLYAYGDAHLRNEADATALRHLMAEQATVATSTSITGVNGDLNNPNIYASHVNWTQLESRTDSLGQQDKPLYITTKGNDTERNGFVLDAAAAGSRLDTLVLHSGSTLYPFIYRTGENLSSIGQAAITFSGGLYMNTAAVYDALSLHQRSFAEGADSVAIHNNVVTIDSDLTLRGNFVIDSENDYDFTLNGTLYFRDMEQAQLRFQGVANKLDIAGIDAGEADLELESDAAVNDIGSISAGSVNAVVSGDLLLNTAGTQRDITLRSETGRMLVGTLASQEGGITLQSSGDLMAIVACAPQAMSLTSTAGGITLTAGLTAELSLTAKNDITAEVLAAEGETLHLSNAVSKSGSVNLTTVAGETLLEGAVKGREVTLNASGILTAAGGRISAPTGKLHVTEHILPGTPKVVRTKDGYQITLNAGLTDIARDNCVFVMRGVELVLLSEHNEDFTGSITIAEGASLTLSSGLNATELNGAGTLVFCGNFAAGAETLSCFSGTLRTETGTLTLRGLNELNGHYAARNLYVGDTSGLVVHGSLDIAEDFTTQRPLFLEFNEGEYRLGSWANVYEGEGNTLVTLNNCELWVRGDMEETGRIQMQDSTLHLSEGSIGSARLSDGCTLTATALHINDLTLQDGSRLTAEESLVVDTLRTFGNTTISSADFRTPEVLFGGEAGQQESLTVIGTGHLEHQTLTAGKSLLGGQLSIGTLAVETGAALHAEYVSVGTMRLEEDVTFGDVTTNWDIDNMTLSHLSRFDAHTVHVVSLYCAPDPAAPQDNYASFLSLLADELQVDKLAGSGVLNVLSDNQSFDYCTEFDGMLYYRLSRDFERDIATVDRADAAPGTQGLTSTLSAQNLAELAMSQPARALAVPAATDTDSSRMQVAPVIRYTTDGNTDNTAEDEEEKRKVTSR